MTTENAFGNKVIGIRLEMFINLIIRYLGQHHKILRIIQLEYLSDFN